MVHYIDWTACFDCFYSYGENAAYIRPGKCLAVDPAHIFLIQGGIKRTVKVLAPCQDAVIFWAIELPHNSHLDFYGNANRGTRRDNKFFLVRERHWNVSLQVQIESGLVWVRKMDLPTPADMYTFRIVASVHPASSSSFAL